MKLSPRLEEYRFRTGEHASPKDAPFGAFRMPGPCGCALTIIASDGDISGELGGWEHVSVSTERRIPNWIEMCFVKNLFWESEDCVVQFHPPRSEYVNNHERVLHLWRWTRGNFPLPPSILVGVKDAGLIKTVADAERIQKIAADYLADRR